MPIEDYTKEQLKKELDKREDADKGAALKAKLEAQITFLQKVKTDWDTLTYDGKFVLTNHLFTQEKELSKMKVEG